MKQFRITPVGEVNPVEDGFAISIKKEFRDGLKSIEGFSHLNILWYAHNNPDVSAYHGYVISKPYVKGPEYIGIFATRSQIRPNPIGVTVIYVLSIDYENGIIYTPYIDTDQATPVLDIKPYLPSTDRLKNVNVPEWCMHWPDSIEKSASFDWEKEFNF